MQNRIAEGFPVEGLQVQAWTAPTAAGPWPTSPYVPAVSPTKDRPPGWLFLKGCLRAGASSDPLTAAKPSDHHFVKIDVIRSPPPGGPKGGDPPWPRAVVLQTQIVEPPLKAATAREPITAPIMK